MDSRDRRRNEERIDDGSGGWNLKAYSRPSSNGRICRCRRDRKTRSSRVSQNSIRRRLRAASRRHRDEIGGSSRGNGLSKVSKNRRLYKNHSSRASTQRTSSSRSRDSSRSGSRRSSRASSRKNGNGKKIYRRRTQATVAAAAAPRLKAALKKKAVLNQNRRVNHGARRVSFTSNRNVIRNEAANNAPANNGTIAPAAAAPPAYFRALPLPPRYVPPRHLRDEGINNDPAPSRNVNRAHQVPPLGPIINGFQTATRHPHGNYYVPPPPTPAQGFDENGNLHQRGPSTRAPHYVAELGRRLERAEQLRDENIERYYENNRHLYLGQPTQLNFDESDDEMPVATSGQEYNDTSEEDSVTSDWGSTRPNRPNFSHLIGQGPAKPKGISALWQEQHPGWEDGRYHIDRITLPFESQSPSAIPRRSSAYRDHRDSSRRCSRRCSTSSSRQYSPHQNRRQSSSRRQEPPLISRASPRHPAASSGSVIFGGSRQSRRRN